MLKQSIFIFITAVFSLLTATAIAAEDDDHDHGLHTEDIQPWRIGAEIFVNNALFETDFGDLGGGPFVTDDPGVDVNIQKGTFTPGNWLRFQPVGQLLYWDGGQWRATVPNGERIEITDALNNTVSFSIAGVSETAVVIGEINNSGGLHEHLNFRIFDASDHTKRKPWRIPHSA